MHACMFFQFLFNYANTFGVAILVYKLNSTNVHGSGTITCWVCSEYLRPHGRLVVDSTVRRCPLLGVNVSSEQTDSNKTGFVRVQPMFVTTNLFKVQFVSYQSLFSQWGHILCKPPSPPNPPKGFHTGRWCSLWGFVGYPSWGEMGHSPCVTIVGLILASVPTHNKIKCLSLQLYVQETACWCFIPSEPLTCPLLPTISYFYRIQ